MSDLTERLRESTAAMAASCSAPMELWNEHSNAALSAAVEIERLRAIALDMQAAYTEAADEIDRLTRELAEVQKDRDYWKVEAEGEREKVEFRDKLLAEARDKALEEAAKVVEEKVRGITIDVFVFNGTDAKNRQGHTEFVSTQHMQSYLQNRAAAIRALKEKP